MTVKRRDPAEDDIAIIGMAGLYPQADDIDVFWSNVLEKKDCVTESPEGWLGDGSIFAPDSEDPLLIYTRRGGFLGDLSRFDARAFGTMPLSVTGGQPDQFLALKVAHDALVDAGYPAGRHDHQATGVILGHAVHAHRGNSNGMQQAWFHHQLRAMLAAILPGADPARIDAAVRLMQEQMPRLTPEAIPGLVPNIMTGRICNRLDLMGPNYIIDAACSSSIIAVDLAISELRAGRADMMLAGGVNTTTSPLVYGVFCSVDALSRDGRIRPFDKGANGTVLGEGAGVIVLKRLADALRDEDRIHAVIKGVGQSSDGKSSGLMAPRLEGEVLAVRRAYAQTGIDPATIGLLEAHGTGIPLGDRTEVEALRTVFGARDGRLPTVPVGSVKSMIGHCIPASGSAGIIKMALSLSRKVIPPTLCDEVSGEIGLGDTPFYVSTETRPWIHSGQHPRRAAINAFGFGGINAHMILEESPVGRSPDPTAAFLRPAEAAAVAQGAETEEVFVFAGETRAGVLAALDVFAAEGFDAHPARSRATWDAVLAAGGTARLAIVAAGAADLEKKIATVRAKLPGLKATGMQTRNGIHYEDAALAGAGGGKVAFLFPGEMGQYPAMMRDAALAFPVVRDCFDFIASLTEGRREVRLQDVIYPAPTLVDEAGRALLDELIHRVDYGSEMVFAADQAVFALMRAMGVAPDAMLGHSTGENAALVASGLIAMDRAQVGAMIARMNTIFGRIEAEGSVPSGALLNVAALPRVDFDTILARHRDIHFTMDNCPNQTIVFGARENIDAFQRDAVAMGAVCTLLPISWGYHTPFVAPMAQSFGTLFEGVDLAEPSPAVRLYSCGTAAPFPTTRAAFQETAIAQYTSRVRFTEAIERLHADGVRVFIECGPNAVLSAFVRDILGDRPHLAVAADNRRRGMVAQLRHLAAQLFVAGVGIDPRDVLMPLEAPEAAARRAVREKQRKAPRLPSDLPFIRLEGEVREAVRALLVDAAPAAVPAGMPQVAPRVAQSGAAPAAAVPVARPVPPVRPPAAPVGAEAVMAGHFGLMRDFLQGQGRVAQGALAAPPRGGARVEVMDLSGHFALPFAFRACLMRGAPPVTAVLPHLTPAEREEMLGLPVTRQEEWALSRLAVKRAAGSLMAGNGAVFAGDRIGVAKTAEGVPVLDLSAFGQVPGAVPAISLAHVRGGVGAAGTGATGLGAAAEPRWQVGIDYEMPGRLGNPGSFLDHVISPEEWRILGLPAMPGAEAAVMVWSAKEAAAKALGTGLTGRPRDFAVTGSDAQAGRMQIRHGERLVEAQVRRLQDAVCAVAYTPSLGGWKVL
jgi:acyl transferase domain-containing protein/phosphopantetheinyl transferase (holo-ACP synthase)